ncbi:YcjF family protein [Photobacterium sp. 1_MG-2023]|uniref:YcjF family protein n=1 Tax=Photobacterium sp. 1_MG-2023 TaxID=3062646 RepID=UPI0026E1354E|nr:TIGR01620 family protein [Photobacterium sp. 1_MG-2023]MDO6706603.1 TIGR01620 family protein [Photobacterium sp. 1_MG-2023]
MTKSFQSKIVFDETEQAQSAPDLKTRLEFAQEESFLPSGPEDASETQAEAQLEQTLGKRKSKGRWLKTLLLGGVGLTVWQSVDYVYSAYQSGDWLSLGWSVLVASVAATGIVVLGREWYRLRRLKDRQTEREQAELLLAEDGIGQGKAFCIRLAKQGGISAEHAGYSRWQESLAATHNDAEVLAMYDQLVVSQQDKAAKKMVVKYAREAALMVAVSPLAIADVLLVAWRNFRLIDQIAAVYGIELGYWSRIQLFKLVLKNMAIAGASELITDSSMDLLSVHLTGRLSARAAQGLGVGLLTGRLGLKAINLMRPLPWQPDQAPALSDIRRDLLGRLGADKSETTGQNS